MAGNADMMRQIYTLLEQNVFFGDRLTSGQFVALLSPGQFISTDLNPNSLNDQHTIWKLANSTMAASFVWKPTMSTISGLYAEIMQSRALPHDPLTQQQQRELEAIRRQLTAWQPQYRKYKKAWDDADLDLSRAITAGADELELIALRRARDDALDDWENLGHKYDYEQLKGQEWDLVASDPDPIWQEYVQQYKSFKRTSPNGDYLFTTLTPHPSEWPKAGWAKQTLNLRDVYQHEYSHSTHFDAGVSGGWGLWSFGGSYSKDTLYQHQDAQTTELHVEFEYLVATIDRPWLSADVLDRRFWCWKKNVHDNLLLSDGGNLNGMPLVAPVGAMPLIPTHMFIVRNVRLTGAWTNTDMTFYHEKVTASLGGGWGPWSAHGSYMEETTERTYTGNFKDATLVIDQPQLMAVAGTLLHRVPDPDLALKWGPDANLEPAHYSAQRKDRLERMLAHRQAFAERQYRRAALEQMEIEIADARRKEFEESVAQVERSDVAI